MKFHEFGTGNPTTLVLLHGFATTWEQSFHPLIELAQKDYHVIAMAMDGFNPDEPDKHAVFVEKEAQMLADYLLERTGGSVDIVYGASMGGMVLSELLLDERITVGTAIADGYTVMQYPTWLPRSVNLVLAKISARLMYWVVHRCKPLLARLFRLKSVDELNTMMYTGMSYETMLNSEYGLMDYRYKHHAFARASSHIWNGEGEKGVNSTVRKMQAAGIPIRSKTFPGLGHGGLLMQPERLLAEISQAHAAQ